jgi:predicted RNase H-like HicB family nuclease
VNYLVVIEQGANGFGAYVPDLPRCVAVGDTREEELALIQEAMALHLELLREDGLPIQQPHSVSEYVAVAA